MEIRPPKSVRTAEQAVELALDTFTHETRNDPTRVTSLRVSSFPFCATWWWLSLPGRLNGSRKDTFMSAYFTSVGHAVHTNVQGILDSSPFVIRDWKCRKCDHRHEFMQKPRKCEACGSTKAYFEPMENEVRAGVIVGHIDDAFLVDIEDIDLLDYKTTSARKINSKIDLPNLENVRQIEAYCAIKKRQGHRIRSWTLCYICRDNGKRRYITARQFYGHSFEEEYPRILKRLGVYVRDFKDIASVTSKKQLPEILARRRLTETRNDPEKLCGYCEYNKICPNSKKTEALAYRTFDLIQKRIPIVKVAA